MSFRRASPLVRISDFDKSNLSGAESAPSASDAISLVQSGVEIADGFAQPLNAILPDKHDYQRLRFVTKVTDASGATPSTVEFTLWERTPDGEIVPVETVALAADGTVPDIEMDNHDARYYFTMSTLTGGTTPDISAKVYVQGVHTPTYVAADT